MKIQQLEKFKIPNDLVYTIKGAQRLNRYIGFTQKLILNKQKIKNNMFNVKTNKDLKIIISLTSFPDRINIIHNTIKSLFNQSIQIDEIVLWLAKEQFSKIEIPVSLKRYENYGLKIKYCDDLKSHKKYYYTMLENPNDVVITVDDDLIYPENTIEKLILKHYEFPNCIICNEGREIIVNEQNKLSDYTTWKKNTIEGVKSPSSRILPVGCGGVLYPPNSLNEKAFDKELIQELAPYTDDLWLKIMSALNKTMVVKTSRFSKPLTKTPNSQITNLTSINVHSGNNDKSLSKICKVFPNSVDFIKNNQKIILTNM